MKTFDVWILEELSRNSWYDSVQKACMQTAYNAALEECGKQTVADLQHLKDEINSLLELRRNETPITIGITEKVFIKRLQKLIDVS